MRKVPNMRSIIFTIIFAFIVFSGCKKDSPTNTTDPSIATPSMLQVLSFEETAVSLQWQDNSNNEDGFDIEQRINDSAFVKIKALDANKTSVTITGTFLATNVYSFRARAYKGSRKSEYTNIVSAQLTKPVAHILSPQNNAVITDSTTIEVAASDNNGVVRLEIYIDNQLDSSRIFVVPPYKTAWFVYAYLPAVHTIYSKAYDGDGNITSTAVLTVTTQLSAFTPTNLTAEFLADTSIELHWQDNCRFETGFEIEKSVNDSNNFSLVQTVGANVATATIAGVYNTADIYYFRVRAISSVNSSSYSIVASNSLYPFFNFPFVNVLGGVFTMGSPLGVGIDDEHPQHYVILSNFSISQYEVTQAVWKRVVMWKQSHGGTSLSPTPSYFAGNSLLPVETVSWNDISLWLGYLNEILGTTTYRLPTEAEWEYAARGGTHWNDNFTYSGSNNLDSVAWYYSNSGNKTHKVGTKGANQLGIYDMSGNVWEWCSDWYGPYSSTTQTDPQGPTSGSSRVFRGGSFVSSDFNCRVAVRNYGTPGFRDFGIGFRLSRTN